MLVLIAPDKFKGTLTATEAAEAIARGWLEERSEDDVVLFPISDGGDGFGQLLGEHLRARMMVTSTVNAAGQPIEARWWWVQRRRWAIVESAQVVGLAQLQKGRFHPFDLDTRGLAAVLRDAAKRHPIACLVGIGGSATNDGGFGMACGLGWRFLDSAGRSIKSWTDLTRLETIKSPSTRLRLGRLVVAVDVRNPLLGRRGATRIYGPQKGIRPEDMRPAEASLRRLVRVLATQWPKYESHAKACGAGAAGGLGFGLCVFAGAKLEPGFDLFARLTAICRHIQKADLVITGEGAIDETTLAMGKGVGQMARLAKRFKRPCIGLAGVVAVTHWNAGPFAQLLAMTPDMTSTQNAMNQPHYWLSRLAALAARNFPGQTT